MVAAAQQFGDHHSANAAAGGGGGNVWSNAIWNKYDAANSNAFYSSTPATVDVTMLFDASATNATSSPTANVDWTTNLFSNVRVNVHEKTPPPGTAVLGTASATFGVPSAASSGYAHIPSTAARPYDALRQPPPPSCTAGNSAAATAYFYAGMPLAAAQCAMQRGVAAQQLQQQLQGSHSRSTCGRQQQPHPINCGAPPRPTTLLKPSSGSKSANRMMVSDATNTPSSDAGTPTSGSSGGQMPKNPKLYKTELCRSWMDSGRCNYGERCQYAHGETEKRPIPRHPKYKTEACQSYHKTGYCPYGPRCHFIHNEEPHMLAQLVAQNAMATAAAATKNVGNATNANAVAVSSPQRCVQQQQQQSAALVMSPAKLPLGTPPMAQASQRPPLGVATPLLPTGQLPQQIPIQHFGHQQAKLSGDSKQRKLCNSVGDSPVPSSIDSGTDSPLDSSFSPGLDYEDAFRSPLSPNALRRSLKAAGGSASYGHLPGYRSAVGPTPVPATRQSAATSFGAAVTGASATPLSTVAGMSAPTLASDWANNSLSKGISALAFTPDAPLQSAGPHTSPSSVANDSGIGSIFSSGANSPGTPPGASIGGSPPEMSASWTPTSAAAIGGRLPIFERLSNGPL